MNSNAQHMALSDFVKEIILKNIKCCFIQTFSLLTAWSRETGSDDRLWWLPQYLQFLEFLCSTYWMNLQTLTSNNSDQYWLVNISIWSANSSILKITRFDKFSYLELQNCKIITCSEIFARGRSDPTLLLCLHQAGQLHWSAWSLTSNLQGHLWHNEVNVLFPLRPQITSAY